MSNKRLVLLVAATALAVTACGSTVEGLGNETTGGNELSIGGGGSAAAVPGAAGVSPTGPAGAGVPAGATGTAAAGGSFGSPGGVLPGGSSLAETTVGITDKAVYVGILYEVNTDAADSAFGAGNITSGNTRADAQAVVSDINANGGVAGRTLVPVWHAVDTTSQDTFTDQDNQSCGALTQDNHIFVAAGGGYTPTFTACVQNAGASVVSSAVIYGPDISTLQRYPDYYELNTAVRQRLLGYEVTSLARQSYFTGWQPVTGQPGSGRAKVGVVTYDRSDYTPAVNGTLLPALARAGHPVAGSDVARVFSPNRTAQYSTTEQQIQTAVLRFRQDHVTHVILDDTTGTLTLLFLESAQSQHWYPRLGINTSSAAEVFFEGHDISKQQLNGALGLGWTPSLDLSASMGDHYQTSATVHCLQVMKQRTGQTYSSTNAATLALADCDALYLIRDALDSIHGTITRTKFRQAIEAMGTRYVSSIDPGTFLGPGEHHAAVNTVYDMRFDASCPCVRYGGTYRLPG
jgi:predicted small secreted protein